MNFSRIRASFGRSRVTFDHPFKQHHHSTNAADPGVRPPARARPAAPGATAAPRQPLPARPQPAATALPAVALPGAALPDAPGCPLHALRDPQALPALLQGYFPAASPAAHAGLLEALRGLGLVQHAPADLPGMLQTFLAQALASATAGDAALAVEALAALRELHPQQEIAAARQAPSDPASPAAGDDAQGFALGAARPAHWSTFGLRPQGFALGAARRAHWGTFGLRPQGFALGAARRAHAAAWRVLRELANTTCGADVLPHLLASPVPPEQRDNFALLMKAAAALGPQPGDDARPTAPLLRPDLHDSVAGQAWLCAAARLAGQPGAGEAQDWAFNSVRNDLYDTGPGSDFAAIDARLRKMARWIDRAADDRPLELRNPLTGKSPFRALRRLGVQQVDRGTAIQRHRPAFEAALRGAARDLQAQLEWQAQRSRAPNGGQVPQALVRAAVLEHCTALPPPASMDRHRFDDPDALQDITTRLARRIGDPLWQRPLDQLLDGRRRLLQQVQAVARQPMTLERLERWARQADEHRLGAGGSRIARELAAAEVAAAAALARVQDPAPAHAADDAVDPAVQPAAEHWAGKARDCEDQVAQLHAVLQELDGWLAGLDPAGPCGDMAQALRADRDATAQALAAAEERLDHAFAAWTELVQDPPAAPLATPSSPGERPNADPVLPPELQAGLRGAGIEERIGRHQLVWLALPDGGAALARLNERAARQQGTPGRGLRSRLQGPPRPLEGRRLQDFEAQVRQDVMALARTGGMEPRLAAIAMRSALQDGSLDGSRLLAPDRALLLDVLERLGRGAPPPSAGHRLRPEAGLQQRIDAVPVQLQAARDEAHGRDTRVRRISRPGVKRALENIAENIEGSSRLRLSSGGIVGFGLRQVTASLSRLATGLFVRARVDARAQVGRQAVFEFAMPPYNMEMVLGTQRQAAVQAGLGGSVGPDLGVARIGAGVEWMAYAREWAELDGVSLRLPRIGVPLKQLREDGARLAGCLVDGVADGARAGEPLLKQLLQQFPQLTVNLIDRAGDGRRRHGLTVKAGAAVGASSVRASASAGATLEAQRGIYKHYHDRTGSLRVTRSIHGQGWRGGLGMRVGFGPEFQAGPVKLTSHNTDLTLVAAGVDLLAAGGAAREELVSIDGRLDPISFHETEYQNVEDFLAVMAQQREAWLQGRLAADPQRDPAAEAARFDTFLAQVRQHATPTQVFASRESLKPAVARQINAGRDTATLAARQCGGPRQRDIDAQQAAERRLLDDPASWQPYSARSYERAAAQSTPGLHLVLVLAALDAAEASHIDNRFDVN